MVTAALIAVGVVFSVALYAAIAGGVGLTFYRQRIRVCRECNPSEGNPSYYTRCISDHVTPAGLAGVGWPFFLPIIAGMWFADRGERASKKAARLAKEIDRLEREMNIGGRR